MAGEAKYWTGLLYPENMIPNWRDKIDDCLEYPFCYIVHDKDLLSEDNEEERKVHVHVIVAWPNNTTRKAVCKKLNSLSLAGKKCSPDNRLSPQPIGNVERMYKYIIHDQSIRSAKGKHEYSKEERIEGNNFDIGNYIQISEAERKAIRQALFIDCVNMRFTNYAKFAEYALGLGDIYFDVMVANGTFFDRVVKGNRGIILDVEKGTKKEYTSLNNA